MVDLPEPDRPMMTNTSPSRIEKLAFWTPMVVSVLSKISSFSSPCSSNWRAFFGCGPKILNRSLTSIFAGVSIVFPGYRYSWQWVFLAMEGPRQKRQSHRPEYPGGGRHCGYGPARPDGPGIDRRLAGPGCAGERVRRAIRCARGDDCGGAGRTDETGARLTTQSSILTKTAIRFRGLPAQQLCQ